MEDGLARVEVRREVQTGPALPDGAVADGTERRAEVQREREVDDESEAGIVERVGERRPPRLGL